MENTPTPYKGTITAPRLYVGTKIIVAIPFMLSEFKKLKGTSMEDGATDECGYLVQYDDGYQSWSPEEVFERCYRPLVETEIATITRNSTTFPK